MYDFVLRRYQLLALQEWQRTADSSTQQPALPVDRMMIQRGGVISREEGERRAAEVTKKRQEERKQQRKAEKAAGKTRAAPKAKQAPRKAQQAHTVAIRIDAKPSQPTTADCKEQLEVEIALEQMQLDEASPSA